MLRVSCKIPREETDQQTPKQFELKGMPGVCFQLLWDFFVGRLYIYIYTCKYVYIELLSLHLPFLYLQVSSSVSKQPLF